MGNTSSLIQEYPPPNWVCPSCGKKHSKAHYSVPGQIDPDKNPGEPGRVLFNRRKARANELSLDTPIDHSKPMKGEPLDENGLPRGIYCPHCGYEDKLEVMVKK